jgi:hypothetical protein
MKQQIETSPSARYTRLAGASLALVVACTAAQAQSKAAEAGGTASAVAQSALEKALGSKPMPGCERLIKEIDKVAVGSRTSGAAIAQHPNEPTTRLMSGLVAFSTEGDRDLGDQGVALLATVPRGADQCDGTYTTVLVATSSCLDLAKAFRQSPEQRWREAPQSLEGLDRFESQPPGLSRILIPAGRRCVLLTTETLWGR